MVQEWGLGNDYKDSTFLALLDQYVNDGVNKTIIFKSEDFGNLAKGMYATLSPRQLSDFLSIGPEIAVRLISRLAKRRHIF